MGNKNSSPSWAQSSHRLFPTDKVTLRSRADAIGSSPAKGTNLKSPITMANRYDPNRSRCTKMRPRFIFDSAIERHD